MTYFRTGAPYYHRRAAVSRSCSGWEGVVPAGYGRQALIGHQGSGIGNQKLRDSPRCAADAGKVRVGLVDLWWRRGWHRQEVALAEC